MKQENRKISLYNRVRRGLYMQVEARERRDRQKLIVCALTTLLIASILLFCASLMETSNKNKYVYFFGNTEQIVDKELAVSGDIRFIDMNALADYCNIEKDFFFSQIIYRINGTQASFEDGSNIATVNEITIEMPEKAVIKNGYCLIPISSAQSIIQGISIDTESNETSITSNGKDIYMVANNFDIEYETDISKYLQYINSNDEYIFTLANKQNPLGEDFSIADDNLVEIPAEYRKSSVIYLYTIAEKALEAMMQDMFAAGFDDTYVTSAYRSYAYQEMLFEMYIEQEMDTGLSYDEAREKVLTYSSEPGKSEHQTGLCVDFTTRSIGGVVDDVFESTEVFDWLVNNSWKYGFVLRYPEDKVDITGYAYESWHYRFVGLERASIMYQTGLCYEEYLEKFE